MNLMHSLNRLARIPKRLRRDLQIVQLVQNWRAAVAAEWSGARIQKLCLRNGVVLSSPNTIDLAFLFQETWINKIYTPPGYEIRQGELVIDVGANIGTFSAYAATRASDVKVYSYEPFPENANWLRRNVGESNLSNVQIHEQAVAARSCIRYMQVNETYWIAHSLMDETGEREKGLRVNCISLDEIINRVARCDLLKLDCEGSEYEILQNCAPETFSRVRRVVIEYHKRDCQGGTGQDLSRLLESHSFRIDKFEPSGDGEGILCASNESVRV